MFITAGFLYPLPVTADRPVEEEVMSFEPPVAEVSEGAVFLGPEEPVECSCVKYIREKFIHDLPRGDAVEYEANTPPFSGAVAIYKYGEVSHIGYVEKIEETGYWERGGNLERCRAYRRFMKWGEDKAFLGFWKKD